ncbi:hypothetical protein JQX08_07520 [Pseudomonas sp. UL073]|uniref:Uncharacterized protein n=1 Tax=Zestomonas insulae TaxID=2809017 RepID=A0ABS2IE50_9GAMM|nr:hypothetical protein [Pseudomonas insulae]MBM7060554.1 hypothetical protein [Pseudomonas insulae]
MTKQFIRLVAVTFALGLALTGCSTTPFVPASQPQWAINSTLSKEQIWGPYRDLAGTSWTAPDQHSLSYRWVVQDMVLAEEIRHPYSGQLLTTNTILPGSRPGELTYWIPGGVKWDGKMEGTDTATFALNAFVKHPFRIQRTSAGALVREGVTLSGDVVASVDSSVTFTSSGTAPAVASSAAPSTMASPSRPASTPSGVKALTYGEKTDAVLDARSLTAWHGARYHLYSLPARKGEKVVVVTECHVSENSNCWYLNTVGEEALIVGWDDKILTPKGSAYLFTLESDYEVIRVGGYDDVAYKIFAATGASGDQLWSEYRTDQQAYAEEKARQAREAERLSAESSSNNAAMFNAVMTGLSQGMAAGVADAQAAQASQDALLNSIAYTAQAAQAQQAYAAQEAEAEETYAEVSSDSSDEEAQQDATVAAALAQTQQLVSEGGGDQATLAQLAEVQQGLQQRQAQRKQQAGTNKILPSKIQLSTATNSITPSANLPDAAPAADNMARGKVRLCNRPGDEGPAHWPTCPQTRAEEVEAKRLAAAGGSGDGKAESSRSSSKSRKGSGSGSSEGSGVSGGSGSGSQNSPGKASTSDDETFAWCNQPIAGRFRCWGPNAKTGTYGTLKIALDIAGCPKGEGDSPAVGESTFFHCHSKLPPWRTGVPESHPDW